MSGLSGDIGIFAVHARSFYFFNGRFLVAACELLVMACGI